jgi:hypothetical protein
MTLPLVEVVVTVWGVVVVVVVVVMMPGGVTPIAAQPAT